MTIPEASMRVVGRVCRGVGLVQTAGAEAVPRVGPVILVANHARRQLDPLLVALAVPRRLTFVAGDDLRSAWLVRLASRASSIVFVSAFAPLDVGFVRTCERILRAGDALVIFPEGRAMGDGAGLFRRGAAYLALRTGTALQPVWIERRRSRAWRVLFGRPFHAEHAGVDRRNLDTVTVQLHAATVALGEGSSSHEGQVVGQPA